MLAHRDKGMGIVVVTNSNHPDFISEVINSAARVYKWPGMMPVYKKLPMDTSKFSAIRGRYHNGADGSIVVSTKGDRLFMKYLRGKAPFELFQITDSTYMNKDTGHGMKPVQFRVNPADGKLNLVLVEKSKPVEFTHAMEPDVKVPFEYLLAGDFDKALTGYKSLMKASPKDNAINEENLNSQGYDALGAGKIILARDIFRVNMMLYPESANTYDSYAEACMKNGDKKEAIRCYKIALKMNPDNSAAAANIRALESSK